MSEPAAERPPRFDFRPGAPDVGLFPRDRWLRSVRRGLAAAPDLRLDYGDPRGAPSCAARSRSISACWVRGLACTERQVLPPPAWRRGSSCSPACSRSGEGRRSRSRSRRAGPGAAQLIAAGLEPAPVPVDDHGLRVDRLPLHRGCGAARDAGAPVPDRARALAPPAAPRSWTWAASAGGLVLEDDYDAEYRYDRSPVGALQGLAPDAWSTRHGEQDARPRLRLGWLVAPPASSTRSPRRRRRRPRHAGDRPTRPRRLSARGELDRHLRRTPLRSTGAAGMPCWPAWPSTCPASGPPAWRPACTWSPGSRPGSRRSAVARRRPVRRCRPLRWLSEHAQQPQPPALLLGYGADRARPAIEEGRAPPRRGRLHGDASRHPETKRTGSLKLSRPEAFVASANASPVTRHPRGSGTRAERRRSTGTSTPGATRIRSICEGGRFTSAAPPVAAAVLHPADREADPARAAVRVADQRGRAHLGARERRRGRVVTGSHGRTVHHRRCAAAGLPAQLRQRRRRVALGHAYAASSPAPWPAAAPPSGTATPLPAGALVGRPRAGVRGGRRAGAAAAHEGEGEGESCTAAAPVRP